MTAIAQTAAITLLTGLPGSGKTLRTVMFIKDAIDKGELVYVCNLNGLKVPHIPFEDPRNWRDLPAGSILVVDEAQQFFRARRGGEAPDYLTAMETIRHQGVRLVLTTQQPDYLDTHLRGLVGLHEHLVRENGKAASKIWRHNEVMDNVRSDRARNRYDKETWAYPPELFTLYESAQVHTVKPKMSSRMKKGLIFFGVVGLLLGALAFKAKGYVDDADTAHSRAQLATGGREAAGSLAAPGVAHVSALQAHQPNAVAEYAANLTPRVPEVLGSMPAFDGRNVRAEPLVACMSSEAGDNVDGEYRSASCSCLTEQGTRHQLPMAACASMARWGPVYDPYREPSGPVVEERKEKAVKQPERVAQADVTPGAMIGAPATAGAL
jgi:hypothetical protein